MKIALTGATGFLGRYIARRLAAAGHALRCWYRPSSDRTGLEDIAPHIQWIPGTLADPAAATALVQGCDAIVHAALWRPGAAFQGAEGNVVQFAEINVLGSLRLISAAVDHKVQRFVYISSFAVHDKILDDRPLDETHPLWPASHYGAHKAAVEKFVHSYGLGHGFPISRPASHRNLWNGTSARTKQMVRTGTWCRATAIGAVCARREGSPCG